VQYRYRTFSQRWAFRPGYDAFLEALADPAHENHAGMKDWIGETFDPNAVDVEALANDVAALAKTWTRKPPTKRNRST